MALMMNIRVRLENPQQLGALYMCFSLSGSAKAVVGFSLKMAGQSAKPLSSSAAANSSWVQKLQAAPGRVIKYLSPLIIFCRSKLWV